MPSKGPSSGDVAEVRAGKGSARDRAEVKKYIKKSRKAHPKAKKKKR
jgi:hypothetical protein